MRTQKLIETNRPILQVRENKTKKKKAAKGGLRCLWGKKVFNKYILYILAHITALGSLTKKDAPFAPFYT